jgi:hypothetical protein
VGRKYNGVLRGNQRIVVWHCEHPHPQARFAIACAEREKWMREMEEDGFLDPASFPNEIIIRYEDGKEVRLPGKGLPGLLKMAGDGVLDWMVEVFEPSRQGKENGGDS